MFRGIYASIPHLKTKRKQIKNIENRNVCRRGFRFLSLTFSVRHEIYTNIEQTKSVLRSYIVCELAAVMTMALTALCLFIMHTLDSLIEFTAQT